MDDLKAFLEGFALGNGAAIRHSRGAYSLNLDGDTVTLEATVTLEYASGAGSKVDLRVSVESIPAPKKARRRK